MPIELRSRSQGPGRRGQARRKAEPSSVVRGAGILIIVRLTPHDFLIYIYIYQRYAAKHLYLCVIGVEHMIALE